MKQNEFEDYLKSAATMMGRKSLIEQFNVWDKEIKEEKEKEVPSIIGQKIRFQIEEDVVDDTIIIVGNSEAVELWRKYFSLFK